MRDLILNAKRGLAILLAAATVLTGSGIQVYAEELITNEDAGYAEDYEEIIEVGETAEEIETDGQEEILAGILSGTDAVTDLDGDQEPADDDSIVTDLDGVLCDTKVIKSAMNKKGDIKVSWKMKGAKFFSLVRLAEGEAPYVIYDGASNKKKGYTDKKYSVKTGERPANATAVYVMTAYDKNHQKIGDSYATIPAPLMLSAQTGDDTSYTEVRFMQLKGGISYEIQRSDQKNRERDYQTIATVTPEDLSSSNVKVSTYNGQSFTYITYQDEVNHVYGQKHYYRVKAFVDGKETVQSLYSKGILSRDTLPKTKIVNITGTHEDKGACYKSGTVWFEPVDSSSGDVKFYEIFRSTEKDAKYKRVKRVREASLTTRKVSSLDGQDVEAYGVTLANFMPEVPYYYKVRAIGTKNIAGAFSDWMEYTSHFAPVTGVTAESVNQRSLSVTWNSEGCAKKYQIWRAGPYSESNPEGVQQADYVRIATVANKPSSKGVITYKDIKGLQGASYYLYQIVPVNGKSVGAGNEIPAAARTTVTGPKTVKAEGMSRRKINVTWSATYKPSSYTIQRIVSSPNGVSLKDAEWETLATVKSGTTAFKKRTYSDEKVEMGIWYCYRVISTASFTVKGPTGDVTSVTESSDPDKAVIATAAARPPAPSDFKISLLTDDGNWTGNVVSWKRLSTTEGIKEYVVERKTGSKGTWREAKRVTEKGSSTYKVSFPSDDDRGVHYYYRVYAVYDDGQFSVDGRAASAHIMMPSKIFINADKAEVKVGQTYTVKVSGFEPSGTTFKDTVFTISRSGYLKATKSGMEDGYAYVTFTAQKAGTVTVTVKPKYYTGSSSDLAKKCEIKVVN